MQNVPSTAVTAAPTVGASTAAAPTVGASTTAAPTEAGVLAAAPQTVKKPRIEYIDAVKGVAILAIMVGHLQFAVAGSSNYVTRALFQFHVPVFFLIAGYFFSTKKPMKTFVAERALRLLVPYAFTCGVVILAMVAAGLVFPALYNATAFDGVQGAIIASLYGGGATTSLPAGINAIGAIWFLEALFVASVAFRLCLKAGKATPVLVIALFAAAVLTDPILQLPLNIQPGLAAVLYLYVGYLAKQRDLLGYLGKKENRARVAVLAVALLVVCVAAWFFEICPRCVDAYYGPFYLGLPVSIASSLLVIIVCKFVYEHVAPLGRVLAFLGRNSLLILCVHLVCLDMMTGLCFERALHLDFSNLSRSIDLCFQLALSLGCIKLKDVCPPLKKIFG